MTSKEPIDVHADTRESRIVLGFSERNSWRDAPATFDEHTLTIQGHPVMEDWEDAYMQKLATVAASQGGTVLEIGYGMGIAAHYIQQHSIERHIIIEANRDVFETLETFAEQAIHPVIPLFGFWEDITPTISDGSISGILFDTYPLCAEDIHANHFPFFKEAYRLLASGGILTYYSDEIDSYSPRHTNALREAGFIDIDKIICPVTPPLDCLYWKHTTLLVPIVRK